jgi:hypothetical protein
MDVPLRRSADKTGGTRIRSRRLRERSIKRDEGTRKAEVGCEADPPHILNHRAK